MKFTIRDLLWLTLVVALTIGWWLHHRAWAQKYSATAHDSEIWHARTEELQVRVDLLAEQLRANRAPVPAAAPTANQPGN
jgi:hypothetical protein